MINVSDTNETWYYYYTDALGSIRLITDDEGTIVESYTYNPFGRPRVMTSAGTDGNWLTEDVTVFALFSPLGNPYMFTARRWDFHVGLYYYRFRDYNPSLGRFCQPDPLHYIDGMNLYAYCSNNPINWIDPWGLDKLAADIEKAKIIEDWKKWCDDPSNPANCDGWWKYHQCFTHSKANYEWFQKQGYKHWQAMEDWRYMFGGYFKHINHTFVLVFPKSDDLRIDSYMFVLDSWLWDTHRSYQITKNIWPGGFDQSNYQEPQERGGWDPPYDGGTFR